MTATEHIAAINRVLHQLSTARGQLDAVLKLGEKTIGELDALNATENPDASEITILESRLRGLAAKKSSHSEAITIADAELYVAVEAAIAALNSLAQSRPGVDEAANTILPWCNGSIDAARKAALKLPAFQHIMGQIAFLHTRHGKTDPDEIAPSLLKLLEELSAPSPAAPATA
jgi:hypothetical protein